MAYLMQPRKIGFKQQLAPKNNAPLMPKSTPVAGSGMFVASLKLCGAGCNATPILAAPAEKLLAAKVT